MSTAPVVNIGGAGGTVGLASLANETDPNTPLVTGLVMVGAVETNAAANRMEVTTPIARLTEEALVVVVPAGLLLEEAGVEGAEIPMLLNYIPNSGGGEAVSLILGNNVSAGISGVGEFVEHIEAGTLRALAISSDAPVKLLPDTPTITDAGYDIVLTNWRGLLARGNISDAERAALVEVATALHASEAWISELDTRGWTDAFLPGDEFSDYLSHNITEVTGTLRNIGLVD